MLLIWSICPVVASITPPALASILSLNWAEIPAALTKLSSTPAPIVLPWADDCIKAKPKVNPGLDINPSKPPLSFQLAAAPSKSFIPAFLANVCHQFNCSASSLW